ncbi:hypothetical protein GCM10009416_40970 [Craurococcus roseus]|uniref:Uncharacterized protein n=1 Tax=Craurococcus roseus TaxID=77585 RepID=A0ABN1FVE9_9PROT
MLGKTAGPIRESGGVGDGGPDSRHSGEGAADSAAPGDNSDSAPRLRGLSTVPRLDAPVDNDPAGCFPAIHRPN